MLKYLLYAFVGFWGLWFIWYMTGGPLRDSRKSPFINADPGNGKFEYSDSQEVKDNTNKLKVDIENTVKKY